MTVLSHNRAADPVKYLRSEANKPSPAPKGTIYTCPMHPEIVQEGPGHCPKCGMALEPMGIPAEHDHGGHPELVDFTRRLKVAVPLSLALVALDMGQHVSASIFCPSYHLTCSNG